MSGENGWPPLEELRSEEAQLIRRALDSLGHQQLEILGSIERFDHKIGSVESRIDDTTVQIRAEQRAEFKGVRQQLAVLTQQVTAVGENASHARQTVEAVHKLVKQVQLSDRFVSAPPPPGTTEAPPSIPPPLTLDSHFDFERTPMGGIRLDQKAQAILAQRMSKLEEERRVADAIAVDRASTIAAQKREAAEKQAEADRKAEADRLSLVAKTELDLKKSVERRNWLAAIVAACLAAGGGLHWLVQVLTHH